MVALQYDMAMTAKSSISRATNPFQPAIKRIHNHADFDVAHSHPICDRPFCGRIFSSIVKGVLP
jgi:hypothetical protein